MSTAIAGNGNSYTPSAPGINAPAGSGVTPTAPTVLAAAGSGVTPAAPGANAAAGGGGPNFLETSLPGTHNDLKFTQIGAGMIPSVLYSFTTSGITRVSVSGAEISVILRQNFGANYSTAAEIKTLLEASAPAMALVSVDYAGGNNGTGAICQPESADIGFGPTPLAGGSASIDAPGANAAAGGVAAITPASMTINPAGADNSILFTAVAPGTEGNSITLTIAAPANNVATGVAVDGTAITVTPATAARMIITGSLTSVGLTPLTIPPLDYAGQGETRPYYAADDWILQHQSGTWYLSNPDGGFDALSDAPSPAGVVFTPGANFTGVPTVTAGISSAAQVIAAVNAAPAAAALVTASAAGSVTGAVAAVSSTALSGGAGVSPPSPIAL